MEDYDMDEDEDGCPEASRDRIVDVGSELVTLQPIEFEFDKDILRDSAYPILDEVVKAFIANRDIKLVEVQGHTDEQGNEITLWVGEGEQFAVSDEAIASAFDAEYRRIYGLTIPDVPIEIVTWRLSAFANATVVDPPVDMLEHVQR